MKVVLFCGGLGMRLRTSDESLPKPMAHIGYRPILWHVMKYYAHFGHKDFILALGYKADVIKDYFLRYNECLSNDFVLTGGGSELKLLSSDIDDWRITFVDTGIVSNIGDRLQAVRPYLDGDDYFLANYADGLTDLDLNQYIGLAQAHGAVANFLCVKPTQSFHFVATDPTGAVRSIHPATEADIWINGGFFLLRSSIFDYMNPGDELVEDPFQRLIDAGQLYAHKYEGFWMAMDTLKDRELLQDLHRRSRAPWQLWEPASTPPSMPVIGT